MKGPSKVCTRAEWLIQQEFILVSKHEATRRIITSFLRRCVLSDNVLFAYILFF